MLVLQVKPSLVACEDVAKTDSRHSLQQAKKLAVFCDPHLLQVVRRLVWNPAETKTFILSELCERFKAIAGDISRASASEYAEENGSPSMHARILASE
jgi:hypothetical protein